MSPKKFEEHMKDLVDATADKVYHIVGKTAGYHGLRAGAVFYPRSVDGRRKMRADMIIGNMYPTSGKLATYVDLPAKFDYRMGSRFTAQIPVDEQLASLNARLGGLEVLRQDGEKMQLAGPEQEEGPHVDLETAISLGASVMFGHINDGRPVFGNWPVTLTDR